MTTVNEQHKRYLNGALSADDMIYLLKQANDLLIESMKKHRSLISKVRCVSPDGPCVQYLNNFPNWNLCEVCELKRSLHIEPFEPKHEET